MAEDYTAIGVADISDAAASLRVYGCVLAHQNLVAPKDPSGDEKFHPLF
jgi:hypothetical protein